MVHTDFSKSEEQSLEVNLKLMEGNGSEVTEQWAGQHLKPAV